MPVQQKIITSLWFNGNAEEAINFYVSLFKNSRINSIQHYGKSHGEKDGQVIYYIFFDFSIFLKLRWCQSTMSWKARNIWPSMGVNALNWARPSHFMLAVKIRLDLNKI